MSTLDDVIAETRARIRQLRSGGASINEQNTKAALIDPVLAALGWQLHNIDEVDREYKRKPQDNPVDYALFLMRTPRLFIEAKALGVELNDRKWLSQTLGYATVVGVEWCVLTNGDEYRLYNAHAAVDVEQKLFRSVRISEEGVHDTTRDTLELLSKDKLGENLLSLLWKVHFIDRQVDGAISGLLQEPDPALIRLVQKRLPNLRPPEIRDALKRADIRVSFPSEVLPAATTRPARRRVTEAPSTPAAPSPAATPSEPPPDDEGSIATSGAIARYAVSLADLIAAGIIRAPMRLDVTYKKHALSATVLADGRVEFAGTAYDSPSLAAGNARMTIIGRSAKWGVPPTNGWTFWHCTDPESGQSVLLDVLRQRLIGERARRARDAVR